METENALKRETVKWLGRLEERTKGMKLAMDDGKWAVENVKAYISDCKYFQKGNDWVRAFETVVYAYGIFETAVHCHLVEEAK